MQNKYYYRSRILEHKFREVIRLFSLDIEATKIAQISRLNRNTINAILTKVRARLAQYCEQQSPYNGVIEVDESFFGARRVKGKRGRGGYAKVRINKFRGMNKSTFNYHLKETEFRYNNRANNIYRIILKICKNKPLN